MHVRDTPPLLTNTWVFVDFVSQLKDGCIKSVKLMNRELVLWRTQSGKISLIDAYCTHMGAHLGNGKIRGELLECIFHKRCFTTDGQCQGKGKSTHSYPISLHEDMIFAWIGENPPSWELPPLFTGFPLQPQTKWRILKYRRFNFNFHSKGMAENGVDASHFKIYHKFCKTYEPANVMSVTPHCFISQLKFLGYPMLRKLKIPHEIEIISENLGPCTLVVNLTLLLTKKNFYFKFFYISTPLEGENTNYTLAMAILDDPQKKISLLRKAFEYLYFSFIFLWQTREFSKESKEIWELKSFHIQPDFTQQEKAMQMFHDWYSNFYIKNETETT
jgi:phenylpropionate dioxygenase-like ring-hydroxylating dioxygenase large terminal subunit